MMNLKAFETWLFDLDDTLVDFKKSMEISLKNCHQQFYNTLEFEQFQKCYITINHKLWRQAEEGIISPAIIGQQRFQMLARAFQINFNHQIPPYYEEQLIENTDWIDQAEDLLAALKQVGIKIGFVTNGFAHIQRSKFKNLNSNRYSETLIISEEFGYSKPDRRIFDHTLSKMGSTASQTVMIGDSLTSDGQGARNAKITFCWYNPRQIPSTYSWEPDHTISSWQHLIEQFTSKSVI